jgi:hypothetical protein
MPLKKSSSRAAISSNIKEMVASGHPQNQAVAAALRVADQAKRARKADGGGVFSGYIHGATGGRTDNKDIDVGAGSYVIPADILSGLGEGNSIAGANALMTQLNMAIPSIAKADGGAVGAPVPIVAASGELVIPHDKVAELGGGDVNRGHSILDAMVSHVRNNTIKTLRKLPKPKRD